MGVVTSTAIMAAGIGTSILGGANQYNTAKGNAVLSDAQAYSDELSLDSMIQNAEDMHRQERGREKANSFAGNSGAEQDQALMSRAVTANKQALDLAEMTLQGEAKVRRSRTQSLLFENEAQAGIISSVGSTVRQGYKGYQAYRDAT